MPRNVEITIETNPKANLANSPEFASEPTYTAKDIARERGVSDRVINQKWFPKILEAYHWMDESDFKTGNSYNEFASRKFEEYQRYCSPKIPKRNNGEIMRSPDGKALMVVNPNRIGFPAYKEKVFDSLKDAIPNGAIVEYNPTPGEIVDAEIEEEFEDVLATIDSVSGDISGLFQQARQSGAELGNELANAALDEVGKQFRDRFQQGFGAISASMQTPKKRRKKS